MTAEAQGAWWFSRASNPLRVSEAAWVGSIPTRLRQESLESSEGLEGSESLESPSGGVWSTAFRRVVSWVILKPGWSRYSERRVWRVQAVVPRAATAPASQELFSPEIYG